MKYSMREWSRGKYVAIEEGTKVATQDHAQYCIAIFNGA